MDEPRVVYGKGLAGMMANPSYNSVGLGNMVTIAVGCADALAVELAENPEVQQ